MLLLLPAAVPAQATGPQLYGEVACRAVSAAAGAGDTSLAAPAPGASAITATGTGYCYSTPSAAAYIDPANPAGTSPQSNWPPLAGLTCQLLREEQQTINSSGHVTGSQWVTLDVQPNCQQLVGPQLTAAFATAGVASPLTTAWLDSAVSVYSGLPTAGTCGLGGNPSLCASGLYDNVAAVVACLGSSAPGAAAPQPVESGCITGTLIARASGICPVMSWATACDQIYFKI